MSQLILIDSRLPGIEDIIASLSSETEYLIFYEWKDTLESIKSQMTKPYESVRYSNKK